MRVNFRKISVLIPVVMLPLGLWLGARAFGDRSMSEIVESLTAIPAVNVVLAFGCAAGSYLCLSLFDTLALRYTGRTLPYRKIILTSFVALSIGHNVGVAALSSGALRYRFYSGFGISGIDVGRIILFCGVTVGLGLLGLGGIVMSLRPDLGAMAGLGPAATRLAGAVCLGLCAVYVVLSCKLRKPLCLRGHAFRLPDVRLAGAQVAIGTINFAFVAAALHQLLAGASAYPEMVAAYVLGNSAALLSHVPGGLGVLEYVISSLTPDGDVIGALIGFRIVYYIVPLLLGSLLLLGSEIRRWRRRRTA